MTQIKFIKIVTILFFFLLIYLLKNKRDRKGSCSVLSDWRLSRFLNDYSYSGSVNDELVRRLTKHANEIVYTYTTLPLDYPSASHVIPFAVVALLSVGDMLEMGMSKYGSTVMLHKIASDFGRSLTSVDTSELMLKRYALYNSTRLHRLYHIRDMYEMNAYGLDRRWGLVFVDHRFFLARAFNVINFAKRSTIVVAHDTQLFKKRLFKYEKFNVTSYFRYVCHFSIFLDPKNISYSTTSIYSNFVNVAQILTPIFNRITTNFAHHACDLRH